MGNPSDCPFYALNLYFLKNLSLKSQQSLLSCCSFFDDTKVQQENCPHNYSIWDFSNNFNN